MKRFALFIVIVALAGCSKPLPTKEAANVGAMPTGKQAHAESVTLPSGEKIPVESKPTLYFPTTKGAKWVVHVKAGKLGTNEVSSIVTSVEDKDGARVVTTAELQNDGTVNPKEGMTVVVSEKGLLKVKQGGANLIPPQWLLRLPHKDGESWGEGLAGDRNKEMILVETVIEEDVQVPAGNFRAIKVNTVLDPKGKPIRFSRWYAPSVGEIKKVSYHLGSGKEFGVWTLKAFTSGKE